MSWEPLVPLAVFLRKSTVNDSRGTRSATYFLIFTVREFASRSVAFHDATRRLPFSYKERQTDFVLLPAAASISSAVLIQQPVRRHRGKSDKAGLLDYLIFHRKALILMEVKHSWFNLRTGKSTETLQDKWDDANDQANRVVTVDHRYAYSVYGNRAFRVAMLVSPFWKGASD